MSGGKGLFLTNLIILFILFLSIISIVFKLTGDFFSFELFLLILFLIISIVLMYGLGSGKRWAWPWMLVFYELNMINLLILYFRTFVFKEIMLPLVVAGIGFIIALVKSEPEEEFEEYEVKQEIKAEKSSKKIFTPGKFVASKTGSVYHAPKCDWAKKIKKQNQVWFDDEKEAKKNYKKHSCLK